MENQNYQKRYAIFTGKRIGEKLLFPQQAGDAIQVENTTKPHYIIRMWALPHETYYLCKNLIGDFKYTLFSKKIGEDANPTFQKPIGFGNLPNDLKTYLEIQFTFPRQRVFMGLFPTGEILSTEKVVPEDSDGELELEAVS